MQRPPDGITDTVAGTRLWDRHASPLSFLILAAVLTAALAGLAGGQPSRVLHSETDAARLSVRTPETIRNGEFFETRIMVMAKRPLTDAVIAVSPGLWRDMTINTMIPAAADERFADGSYRFSYGPLAAGDRLEVKVDGQINPPLFAGNRGTITLYDGDRAIGSRTLSIMVLP